MLNARLVAVRVATGPAGAAVRVVVPHTAPVQALTVVVPAARAYAAPRLLASSVMPTTVVFDELQVTEASCCVLLSLNVPVAVKRWAVPRGTLGLPGLSEMETRFGGVSVAGSYNSALARGLLMVP